MTNILMAVFVSGGVVWHMNYQIMLKRLAKWNVPVDRKSWGMGSNKNIPAYIRELRRQGERFDGPLCTMLISTILEGCCGVWWLYLTVYVRLFR